MNHANKSRLFELQQITSDHTFTEFVLQTAADLHVTESGCLQLKM
jgi:hypothetical protein